MSKKMIKIFLFLTSTLFYSCNHTMDKIDLGQKKQNKRMLPEENVSDFFYWTEKNQKLQKADYPEGLKFLVADLNLIIRQSTIYKTKDYNNGRMSGYQVKYSDNTWIELKYESSKRKEIDGYLFYLYGPLIDSYYQLEDEEGIVGVKPNKGWPDSLSKMSSN